MSPVTLAAWRPSAFLAVAGLVVGVGFCGRLTADDDVAEAPAQRAKPQTQADGRGEPTEGPFVVSLSNGDRLTGTILSLDATAVRFRPDVAGGGLDVPLARIEEIGRSSPPRPFEPRGDRLYPVAGGVIHGTLEGIDARGITIDAHLVGPLTLPLDAVAAFVRDGTEQPERTAAARFHEVHDASGSRLVGQAEFTASGATLASDGLTATVAIRQIAAVLFPVNERDDADEATDRAPPRCTLDLLNGSAVVGTAPRLERDRLVVTVAPERHVAVPVDNVSRVSFGSGPAAGRRIVFWSQFADLDEEVAHMVEALREGLPRGWKLEAEGPGPQAKDLAGALKRAGVLVVPEMESFGAGQEVDAAAVGRDVKGFLDGGGTVVIAGVDDDSAGFWEEADIFSLASAERADDGDEFTVVRGHPLGRDVGDSFTAVNATCALETDDPAFEPVARTEAGAAAVLVKKVGRGTVVLLGMDYYKRSPAIDRVLVNAVTLRRGR